MMPGQQRALPSEARQVAPPRVLSFASLASLSPFAAAALLGFSSTTISPSVVHAEVLCRMRSGLVIAREHCRRHERPLNVTLSDGSELLGDRDEIPLQTWSAPQSYQPATSAGADGLAAPLAVPPELTGPLPLVALSPCRLVDTRPGAPSALAGDDIGPIGASLQRSYALAGNCGIPSGAGAVSLNVTAVNTTNAGFLTAAPGGSIVGPPTTSTLNWSASNQLVANAAIVPLDANGEISVFVNQPTNVIIDTNGYFAPMPGDGSAGDRVIAGTVTLTDVNLQYHNFTVNPSATLNVPSGIRIRCTGTFTNSGTIVVGLTRASAASTALQQLRSTTASGSAPAHRPPIASAAGTVAASGEIGSSSAIRDGGSAGAGMTAFEARQLLFPGLLGGGGGGATVNGEGGRGGGSLVVLARKAVTNNGTGIIRANGEDGGDGGGGGGGGGIVILASAESISNSGIIEAIGGDGGPHDNGSFVSSAGGGGGGGGVIHLLAPSITAPGTESVSAGGSIAPLPDGTLTASVRQGGGGGGGGGGAGAGGSDAAPLGGTIIDAPSNGHSLQSVLNPQGLLGF